jgi:hypothetical protein
MADLAKLAALAHAYRGAVPSLTRTCTASVAVSMPASMNLVSPPLVQLKVRPGKTTQKFVLENWYLRSAVTPPSTVNPLLAVGRWIPPPHTPLSSSHSYSLPGGSSSWGVWWDSPIPRPLDSTPSLASTVVYKIQDPHGNLLCYRVDVAKSVFALASPPTVSFCDLIVDLWLWVDESGNVKPQEVTLEDLDEFAAAREGGTISEGDAKEVERVVSDILFTPERIIEATEKALERAVKGKLKITDTIN